MVNKAKKERGTGMRYTTNYSYIDSDDHARNSEEIGRKLGRTYEATEEFLTDMDPRIEDYYQSMVQRLKEQMTDIEDSEQMIRDTEQDFNDRYHHFQNVKKQTENIRPDIKDIIPTTPVPPTTIPTTPPGPGKKFKFDKKEWEEIPPEQQDVIKQNLIKNGLTEDEIEKVINGIIMVDQKTLDDLRTELSSAVKHNPSTIATLERLLGFPILDENNEVDNNMLELAMVNAGKNLGMDIDMTAGSPFKKDINDITVQLQAQYRQNPDIRNKIIETYGIDIFDIEGKVDQEKLAVVRIIDGIKMKDGYDIKKMLGISSSTPPTTAPPTTVPPTTAPPTSPTNPPTDPTPTSPPTTVPPTDPITPIVDPNDPKTGNLSASVKDGFGNVGGGILDAIEKGASRIAKGVSPYSGNVGATRGMNKATAGIIAAASVAAGGVAAGGGVLVSKKLNMVHFTPADWQALGADYQSIIEALMRKVGFSTDDVETFKTSNFKILLSELKEHTKKIEKAVDSNPTCDDELLKLYNYSMLDDQNKVIDYLLFITMIIDGRNTIDEYNMYNVINQSLDNVDDADFLYNGIDMEDYFDDSDNVDVKIYNDPIEADNYVEEETETTDPEIEEEETTYSGMDKEWLKGIGIDD